MRTDKTDRLGNVGFVGTSLTRIHENQSIPSGGSAETAHAQELPMTVPIRYVTIQRFTEESGYTENAIRTKIRDGIWRYGRVWVKAPDGRNLIDVEGYNT